MGTDAWIELRIAAEMFDDAQKARIAAHNKVERGGIDPSAFTGYLDMLDSAEKNIGLVMRRKLRLTAPDYILRWQKESPGIGEHLLARLLGAIGDPYIAVPHYWEGKGAKRALMQEEPRVRTVSQLWQYCGHGSSARRSKGMSAEDLFAFGNPRAKMLLHLIAEGCVKTNKGPYRAIYDAARKEKENAVHTVECVRCGPSGKPAQPGSPWSLGHQHAHALRLIGKQVLLDLWQLRHEAELAAAKPKMQRKTAA